MKATATAGMALAGNALPQHWAAAWGDPPSPFVARSLLDIRDAVESLASEILVIDRQSELGPLVGSAELRHAPVHRWYYYKEGFSPRLPSTILDRLGAGKSGRVVDAFAGVATTALALQTEPRVSRVTGVEYSPFAHFVGATKLRALDLDVRRLRLHVERLGAFRRARRRRNPPELSSFKNSEIFDPDDLQLLLAARHVIKNDPHLDAHERDFFLLGLAAVVEDVSGVMKDGRALRIKRGRRRRRNALVPTTDPRVSLSVEDVLVNQWRAMIEDTAVIQPAPLGDVQHERGDARTLDRIVGADGTRLIAPESVGLHLYSPPYLNCIDYSEVYKLELWLLEFVRSNAEFRKLREGTLRSHPSILFPEPPSASGHRTAPVFEVVDAISGFLAARLPRASVGRLVAHYFEDMYSALRCQFETTEPGGAVACVVANSTFSSRVDDPTRGGTWTLPVPTDVLLARIAEAAGFESVEIWSARELRPRNVQSGSARESVVVARKVTHGDPQR